ncbi:hypothetical protein BN2475_50275 [Paraburkholderia ribeironis]|uniref:Uncharacterized protein n=1 Tax=Paraburkholderia ribeironis TaxID=1247936 RepID=A0A1N7RLF4_9BURK|nr:hypothetical protein BN2475_50275 [Paraburkholderia ribeironis]
MTVGLALFRGPRVGGAAGDWTPAYYQLLVKDWGEEAVDNFRNVTHEKVDLFIFGAKDARSTWTDPEYVA